HGANIAYLELSRSGRCDSGSVMVPCPAFREMAAAASADPTLDLGVHLTLTAEKARYRWGPLTGRSDAAGLTDGDGYLWRSVAEVRAHAHPEAVRAELTLQIETALAADVDVTHLDDHMGAVLAPEFVEIYAELARRYRLPILFPRSLAAYGPIHNIPGAHDADRHARVARDLEAEGHRIVDRLLETPWRPTGPAAERYGDLFDRAGDGFTVFALHPNAPGEIEAIEPETAAVRVGEYELLAGPDGARLLDRLAARRIGMRALRDELRAGGAERHDDRMLKH
ncbi:MAG TPA: ChbG/HpnK family deacetylase, partial [Methylomirabilota bacterium]|nr:ChbG/HpnK family deacetylase [Methylomirabilota bacterium]